jgi:hypothetical protein
LEPGILIDTFTPMRKDFLKWKSPPKSAMIYKQEWV